MNKIILVGVLVSLLLASTAVFARANIGSYVSLPSRTAAQVAAPVATGPVNVITTLGTENEPVDESSITASGATTVRENTWQPIGTQRQTTSMTKTCESMFARIYSRRSLVGYSYWDKLKERMTLRARTTIGRLPCTFEPIKEFEAQVENATATNVSMEPLAPAEPVETTATE